MQPKPAPGKPEDELSLSPLTPESQTQPTPQAQPRPAKPELSFDLQGLSLAAAEVTLYDVMLEVRKEGRVCPLPTRWLEFYKILQDAAGTKALPPPPTTGSSWTATSNTVKRTLFHRHVEWAAANGCLQACHQFLEGLPPSDWLRD